MAEFKTQSGLKNYDYNETDNLFSGVWNLNNSNLDKYDPFITGYSFFVWTKLPSFFDANLTKRFKGLTEKNFKNLSGIQDMSLNVDDVVGGFAGNAYGVATGISKENTSFSMTHQELSGSPMRELYTYWVTGIRDFETGLCNYHGKLGSTECPQYSAKYHTGELLYIVTDPSGGYNGKGIEYACYFTNVMPTKLPQDHLNYSNGDHSLAEIQMDFRGNLHMSQDINELAAQFCKDNHIKENYSGYKVSYDMAKIDGSSGSGESHVSGYDPTFKD